MSDKLENFARSVYDFAFALTGDQENAEHLTLSNLCLDSHHVHSRTQLLCSLKRLLKAVQEQPGMEFKSMRPQDSLLGEFDVMGRAILAAHIVLRLTPEEQELLLGSSESACELMASRSSSQKGKNV